MQDGVLERKRVVKIKKERYNIGKTFCSMQLFF